MIERYYNFDVDRFLRDYEENKRKLKELQIEKQAIADSGGMNYSHIRGGGISDPTAQKAQRREKVDLKIRELESYFASYEKLTAGLSDTEWLLVDYIATPKDRRNFEKLKTTLNYDKTATYEQLNALRRKLRKIAD